MLYVNMATKTTTYSSSHPCPMSMDNVHNEDTRLREVTLLPMCWSDLV